MTDVTIDGKPVHAQNGQVILDVALENDIYIPHLCYYPGLSPLSELEPDRACQLCIVDVSGKTVRACVTPVAEGMVVRTDTPEIRELQRNALTAVLRRHPYGCLICHRLERCDPFDICLRQATVDDGCVLCPRNNNCDLQKVVEHIGFNELPPVYRSKKLPVSLDNSFFIRDNNLCILCKRCVRVCEDIRAAKAINFAYPCSTACPAGIDIPRYIRLIGRGRPGAALAVIREKVPFPGSLGRICVHPCEQACQRGLEFDKPLNIRMLKRYAADNGDDSWKEQAKKLSPTGKSVAIIGAGPAGLTAAYYLAKQGHKATIFERLPEAGGMMRVGIPEYRLPRDILNGEIKDIEEAGVEIKLNTGIESIDSLFEQGFNAVFIGIGSHMGLKLGVDGEDSPGVIDAADFLRRANLGEKVDLGETVGVSGGGNVAIDAARMSLRLGAKKVMIFYRRTRAEMPANPEEVDAALEENIDIQFLATPQKVICEGGKIKLECIRMELGEPDASGRRKPVPVEGSEFISEMDTFIAAVGQRTIAYEGFQVDLGRNNVVLVDKNMMTSREGVFSGGDCVTGPATVIEAIAAGRKAASGIDKYLGGNGDISESLVSPVEADIYLEGKLPDEKPAEMSHLPAESRVHGYDEVELGFEREVAEAEAQRCLQCHVIAPSDKNPLQEAGCQFCGACVDACPVGALTETSAIRQGKEDGKVRTTCSYCGVGCQMWLHHKDGKIVRITGVEDAEPNKGRLCVKGKFAYSYIYSPDRLTTPLIKDSGGHFREASWDEAFDLITEKIKTISKESGPDVFAGVSCARDSNEASYNMQKLFRSVIKTNNIDHCART